MFCKMYMSTVIVSACGRKFYELSNMISTTQNVVFFFGNEIITFRNLLIVDLINPLLCLFGSEDHVVQDIDPRLGYNTLLMRLIPGYLLSLCPHRQFHTLLDLLDIQSALSNSYPNTMRAYAGRQSVPFL